MEGKYVNIIKNIHVNITSKIKLATRKLDKTGVRQGDRAIETFSLNLTGRVKASRWLRCFSRLTSRF